MIALAVIILVLLAFACGSLFGACCARWYGEKSIESQATFPAYDQDATRPGWEECESLESKTQL